MSMVLESSLLFDLEVFRCYWKGLIADVAVRKRHQRWDEIFIIFTRTILKSAKLFFVGNVRKN